MMIYMKFTSKSASPNNHCAAQLRIYLMMWLQGRSNVMLLFIFHLHRDVTIHFHFSQIKLFNILHKNYIIMNFPLL